MQQANFPAPHNIKMCVNGILNNYVCFIELLFPDQWHAIPVRGPGSLRPPPPSPPPFRVIKEKNSEGIKARGARKTKPRLPPSSRSETATEYAYKHNFFMASNSSSMIKQLLKLNWLSQNVVFVSVLHSIMETIIMYNHLRT